MVSDLRLWILPDVLHAFPSHSCDCWRITSKPEVMPPVGGLLLINALVLTGLASLRVVGYPQTVPASSYDETSFRNNLQREECVRFACRPRVSASRV